ncbi:MAG: alanine--tRNA ligase, partial [Flavobacteriales bacterium]|nr:alanine--tRNA ligase [Flavobacteriales bacterium]
MNSSEIRSNFLAFFKSKEHQVVNSAPMVIKNDPTLMFTNAGMNQFKDLFLGNSEIKNTRITDTQKCLRVSGKHNDLEEVGVDTYHHTMFEMLGNWSFGDYFKKEAIEWAWELLVDVYGIDKNKLYFTVFEGDKADGTEMDQEAYDLWKTILERNGLTTDKIIKANKKDNFWEMGETGPCGPCSEIHVDLRSDEEIAKISGLDLVNEDHPQVVEIWNLVFMEFNRMA